jgi:tetratricopeptide (TPR) repeat protein
MKNISESNEFYSEAQNIYALASFNMEDYQAALESWRYLIKTNPNDRMLIHNAEINIAKAFYRSGDKKEAIKKLHMIIEKYGDYPIAQEALMWLGEHYLAEKDYERAVGYYQKLISKFPGSDRLNLAYFELGQAFQLNEEYDKAVYAYKKVGDKKDPSLYAKAKLAIGAIFSRDMDPVSALETYQNIITESPEYARDAYIKMGELFIVQRQYDQAAEAFRNAMRSKGTGTYSDAEIQFRLGDVHELSTSTDTAVEAYLKIPYLYPDETNFVIKAYLRIGRIFENNEQWDQALLTYEKVAGFGTEEALFAKERIDWIKNNILAKLNKGN